MNGGMTGLPTSRLERLVGRVLRAGAIGSAVLLASGLLIALAHPSHLGTILMQAGLLVLLVTPVARVVVSVFEYAAERDWLFLGLTATVLVILLAGLLYAIG